MQHKRNFFQRLFGLKPRNEEKRGILNDLYRKHLYYPSTTNSGEIVTSERGTRIDAVFTSINTIAREVASTPIDIKQDSEIGKVKRKNSLQYRLLANKPNKSMTSYEWMYSNVFCYLGWGNSYNLIIRDGNQQPSELIPLMPWEVRIQTDIDGNLFYLHKESEPIPARNILHFKAYTINGIDGISPIEWNAHLMGYKINQQDYSNNSIGAKPNGFISGDLTDEQMDHLADSFRGRINQNKIPYINSIDARYNALAIPPNEAQFLETAQYTDQKIYGIYNLPPTFAQDFGDGVKSNSEQQALTLVKHTLIPHYMLMEQELNDKLFTEKNNSSFNPLFVKFNANGKLRGDAATRKEYYQTMVTLGVMNADEVRELEDMPNQPKGLGSVYYIQGAMVEKGTQEKINEDE